MPYSWFKHNYSAITYTAKGRVVFSFSIWRFKKTAASQTNQSQVQTLFTAREQFKEQYSGCGLQCDITLCMYILQPDSRVHVYHHDVRRLLPAYGRRPDSPLHDAVQQLPGGVVEKHAIYQFNSMVRSKYLLRLFVCLFIIYLSDTVLFTNTQPLWGYIVLRHYIGRIIVIRNR